MAKIFTRDAPPPIEYMAARRLISAALDMMTTEEIYALAGRISANVAKSFEPAGEEWRKVKESK